MDVKPAGGSPHPGGIIAPPATPRPPTRFDTTLTDDAPPAPITMDGDLAGPGLDLSVGGERGHGIGNGVGDGNGDDNGSGTVWVGADWIYKPVRELPFYWPRAKAARETSAAVLLDCVMPKPGKPERCSVASERPQGLGFGAAALGLSRHFRLRPVPRDGRVMTNVTISVPVTFQTPNVPVP